MHKKIYVIDGTNFSTLEEFYDEISRVLIPDVFWGRNLDAFNDILRGGFGTPDEGFILIWKNSKLSGQKLGYEETVRQLEMTIKKCHVTAIAKMQSELEDAKKEVGETVFDWLVEIIQLEEHEEEVELRLE